MSRTVRICTLAELSAAGRRRWTAGDHAIAVFLIDGAVFATADACPHAAASLANDGIVEDGALECPWHGAEFELSTGRALGGPCLRPLKTYPAAVRDGEVLVTLEDEG